MATLGPVLPAFAAARGRLSRLRAALEALAEAERDQFPLWLPVGLLGGIGTWFWLPDRTGWIGLVLGLAALALGALATMRASRWGPALA